LADPPEEANPDCALAGVGDFEEGWPIDSARIWRSTDTLSLYWIGFDRLGKPVIRLSLEKSFQSRSRGIESLNDVT
jgi:hypothetical protein